MRDAEELALYQSIVRELEIEHRRGRPSIQPGSTEAANIEFEKLHEPSSTLVEEAVVSSTDADKLPGTTPVHSIPPFSRFRWVSGVHIGGGAQSHSSNKEQMKRSSEEKEEKAPTGLAPALPRTRPSPEHARYYHHAVLSFGSI